MDYKEQLRHPKWQKKRLEIMNRDNFQCQCCMDKEDTLTVHHKKYFKGKMAWDYSNKYLTTLCEDCHNSLHLGQRNNSDLIFGFIKESVNYTDYYILAKRIGDIIKEQDIDRGLGTISKLLLAQTIKKNEI